MIRTFGRGRGKTALKIGYAENIKERMKTYYHHNPYFEMISSREGTLYDEKLVHLYLRSFGLKLGILNEWFLDTPETLKLFHTGRIKMLKRVWKKRQELFTLQDFKDTGDEIKRRIYEDLRMTMYNGINQPIDILWKREANKVILKKMRIDQYEI